MGGLEAVVVIGLAVLVGGVLARRLHVAPPLVLLPIGVALGFVPLFGTIELPPEIVLFLFLPALLYWESLNTSLREIRNNVRIIVLAAVGLVLVTALSIGAVANALGLPWPVALALGAIVAPTDATAIASVAGSLPRRTMTTLRAESLINDGTALALYSVAVGAIISGDGINVGVASAEFIWSYVIAMVVGLVIGFVALWVRRFLHEPVLVSTVSLLTPFITFLPAELLHGSGVVAVVTCGLVVAHGGPRIISARSRRQTFGFWQVSSYVLNGALFVLIGVQLHGIVAGLDASSWPLTITLSLVTIVLVIGLRLAWFNVIPYLIRGLDRRPVQRTRRVSARHRFPAAWAGFRGAVSLAAALSLPLSMEGGSPLPQREILIAVTFAVILFTLAAQGLSMPAVIRWAHLPPDPTENFEDALALRTVLEAAIKTIPGAAERLGAPAAVRDRVLTEYRERLNRVQRTMNDASLSLVAAEDDTTDFDHALRLAIIPAKREAVLRLRHARRIDDFVLRRIQSHLDAEELRLTDVIDDE